jgi:ribose 5-phosphate isomerase B
MKISLGADHAGFALKEELKRYLAEKGVAVDDRGTHSAESVDYPDFAQQVGQQVSSKQADCGILVCGSGIGMAIAANKVTGVRAANVTSAEAARLSREHNDANVLTLGARLIDAQTAREIVDAWLNTTFAAGRHQRRVDKIAAMEPARTP